MRQEPTRANAFRQDQGPTTVWRCPTCTVPFVSSYAAKQHRAFASCKPASEAPGPRGVEVSK